MCLHLILSGRSALKVWMCTAMNCGRSTKGNLNLTGHQVFHPENHPRSYSIVLARTEPNMCSPCILRPCNNMNRKRTRLVTIYLCMTTATAKSPLLLYQTTWMIITNYGMCRFVAIAAVSAFQTQGMVNSTGTIAFSQLRSQRPAPAAMDAVAMITLDLPERGSVSVGPVA